MDEVSFFVELGRSEQSLFAKKVAFVQTILFRREFVLM